MLKKTRAKISDADIEKYADIQSPSLVWKSRSFATREEAEQALEIELSSDYDDEDVSEMNTVTDPIR